MWLCLPLAWYAQGLVTAGNGFTTSPSFAVPPSLPSPPPFKGYHIQYLTYEMLLLLRMSLQSRRRLLVLMYYTAIVSLFVLFGVLIIPDVVRRGGVGEA